MDIYTNFSAIKQPTAFLTGAVGVLNLSIIYYWIDATLVAEAR